MVAVGSPVHCICWDSRRRLLVSGCERELHVFKVDAGEALKSRQQHRVVASGLSSAATAEADRPHILKRLHPPLKGPDYCHTDVVKTCIITDTGKIITGGFDKCICIYEYEKLDKPKEAFQRIAKCHNAAIVSMAYDNYNNVILTGAVDGSMKVWSMEGRPLDRFEAINDQAVAVAVVPRINVYWASGRFGRLLAYDPKAPANITDYVQEANSLSRFRVEMMYAPAKTDLLLGATHLKEIVVWQYNPMAAHRVFRRHVDWVECVLVVRLKPEEEPGCDHIFSASADGKILHWQLDAEQNCDVYSILEEMEHRHEKNIYCMVFSQQLNCLITGGEDCTIQVYYMDGNVPIVNDVPLPTSFVEHEGRVTGLALASPTTLISASFDKTIRVWDLATMKLLTTISNAHDTPIQCLDYCAMREELASCGMGNKVKIWDLSRPQSMKLKLVLDHSEHGEGADGDSPKRNAKKSNMMWLTKSDIEGLPQKAAPGMVEETIMNADRDVPEVTQVRWVNYRQVWVTAADDDIIRIWNPQGVKMHYFTYTGGSIQCLYVDEVNQLLLAAMLDKTAYVYDLDDPLPKAKYSGHSDVIRSMAHIPERHCYVTASWDKSLRLWFVPCEENLHAARSKDNATQEFLLPQDYEETNTFVSEFEKAHPLVPPKALTQQNPWQLLQAIGVLEPDAAPSRRGKGRAPREESREGDEPRYDPPGSLGSKLEELNRELLSELHTMAAVTTGAQPPSKGASRGDDARSMSTPLTSKGGVPTGALAGSRYPPANKRPAAKASR